MQSRITFNPVTPGTCTSSTRYCIYKMYLVHLKKRKKKKKKREKEKHEERQGAEEKEKESTCVPMQTHRQVECTGVPGTRYVKEH